MLHGQLVKDVLRLSLRTYGCRVIQKALDVRFEAVASVSAVVAAAAFMGCCCWNAPATHHVPRTVRTYLQCLDKKGQM